MRPRVVPLSFLESYGRFVLDIVFANIDPQRNFISVSSVVLSLNSSELLLAAFLRLHLGHGEIGMKPCPLRQITSETVLQTNALLLSLVLKID
jgi:hypothetical protein